MNFEEEINRYEELQFNSDYVIKTGTISILFTAVHTMNQSKDDKTIKFMESYTKAIAFYLNNYANVSCIVKIKDTGYDSNKDNHDEFKYELIKFVKENNIRLVIDLHGSKRKRAYDIEFGTLNNLSADYSTIKELEESFIENGIKNIIHNNPFKGGAITQYLFNIKNVDVIQLEINQKFRDSNNISNLELLCKSLINFINYYNNKINE